MQTASPELEVDPLSLPDVRGHFGAYGGMYVPETLMTPLFELTEAYYAARKDPEFQKELDHQLREFAGRPTNLYYADRLTQHCGGAKIYLKREDLLHTGAHKINNALGQALLAKRMGKKRIIAETGAGQHGIATAAMCAKMGFECVIYMGEEDMRRQSLNVYRMRLCGAEVRSVTAGQRTLKEAVNEAMRDWVTNVRTTHYIIGSALGSHPFPMMVRDFHRVIGEECRRQILEKEGRLPDEVAACVGGGSNAIGIFFAFLKDLDGELGYLGGVPTDMYLRRAVQERRALVSAYPRSPAAIAIRDAGRRLNRQAPRSESSGVGFFVEQLLSQQNHAVRH